MYESFPDIFSQLHVTQCLTDVELINVPKASTGAYLIAQLVKKSAFKCRRPFFDSWVQKIP